MISFNAVKKIPLINILLYLIICNSFVEQSNAQGVGIGMTNPNARLHVAGYSSASYPMLALTDSGNNTLPGVLFSNSNSFLKWYISGALTGTGPTDFFNINYGGVPFYSTFFSINGNGQVGIGTVSQNNTLQVGNVPGIFSGNGLAIGNGSQGMSFAQYSNTSTWYSNTSFSLMPNTGSGFVGIGTQAPAAAMHVYSASTIATPNVLAEQNNADYARIMFKNSNGNAYTLAAANGGGSGTDNFNIYSNTLGANLVSVTTESIVSSQPTGTINLNGIANINQAMVAHPATVSLTAGAIYNDWLLPNATAVILQEISTSSGSITFTGFSGGTEGRIIYLHSVSTVPITIKSRDIRSAVANRVSSPGGDITLNYGYGVTLIFINGNWDVFSKNF